MIWKILLPSPINSLRESFVSNVLMDKVVPEIGSIVYCAIALGYAEHSGIYIGGNSIVHLNGDGCVEEVSINQFLDRHDGWNRATTIYVSCKGTQAVGRDYIAENAINMLGSWRSYNFLIDNCHQFTSGCITGDFERQENFLWMLKDTAKKKLGCDTWRAWADA